MLGLSLELLRVFSDGTWSGAHVQRLAAAAWEDGWGRGDTLARRLKQAGAMGRRSGHARRDLLRAATLAGLMEDTAKPYRFERYRWSRQRPTSSDACAPARATLHKLRGRGP